VDKQRTTLCWTGALLPPFVFFSISFDFAFSIGGGSLGLPSSFGERTTGFVFFAFAVVFSFSL
jgi:hypothetical protein